MVTVAIVLNRTASVVFDCFETAGHGHLQTETEHVRNFGVLVGYQLLGYLDGTGIVDDIRQGQLSGNTWHIVS